MSATVYARPSASVAPAGAGVASPVRPVRLVVVRSPVQGHGASAPRVPASVYRRRRVLAAVLLVAVLVSAWLGLRALGIGPLTGPERASLVAGQVYVVRAGDTFWAIARRIQPEGDVRPLVDRLVAAHGGASLEVGERIVLPADP